MNIQHFAKIQVNVDFSSVFLLEDKASNTNIYSVDRTHYCTGIETKMFSVSDGESFDVFVECVCTLLLYLLNSTRRGVISL